MVFSVYLVTFDLGGIERSNQGHLVFIGLCIIRQRSCQAERPLVEFTARSNAELVTPDCYITLDSIVLKNAPPNFRSNITMDIGIAPRLIKTIRYET